MGVSVGPTSVVGVLIGVGVGAAVALTIRLPLVGGVRVWESVTVGVGMALGTTVGSCRVSRHFAPRIIIPTPMRIPSSMNMNFVFIDFNLVS